jgi:predicted Zn-dependent protease
MILKYRWRLKMHERINKKKLAVFCVIFIMQSVFLAGQQNDPFSVLDRMFNEEAPTPEDEYYIGRAVAANILSAYEIYTGNPALGNYLNLICQALVINSSIPAIYNGYHVVILNSMEFNAFATPGGHIFITRGLVEAAPSEDTLAGIIAHELAHIRLRHGMRMIDNMRIMEEIDEAARQAAAFAGQNQRILTFRDSVNEFFYLMVRNGYSIEQEFEADTAAIGLLASAAYSPGGLLEMLNVLQRIQRSQRGGFNNTHPEPLQRITNLERQLTGYRPYNAGSVRQDRFLRIMGRSPQ